MTIDATKPVGVHSHEKVFVPDEMLDKIVIADYTKD